MSKEKNLELKKHVNAIHSSSPMSLLQRKMANVLLFTAYDDLLEKETHSIPMRQLSELIGYHSNDYKTLKVALMGLISTVVTWGVLDEKNGEDVWVASSMLADASVSRSVCTYSYGPRMKQLLYRPEMYARINIFLQAKFKSSYGLALYENCIRYQNLKHTPWFTVDVFRKLMGIGEGTYSIFRDFKRRVLDSAVEEVNRLSPIFIVPELNKQGRAVDSIRFVISQNQEQSSIPVERDEALQKLQNNYGFSEKQIVEMIGRYERGYILEKILIVEASASFKEGKIQNLAIYLKTALEEDFQPKKSSKAFVVPENKKIKHKPDLFAEYVHFVNKEIIKIFYELDDEKRDVICDEFQNFIKNTAFFKLYQTKGLSDPLISDQFCDFVKNKKFDWYKQSVSFEAFSKRNISVLS